MRKCRISKVSAGDYMEIAKMNDYNQRLESLQKAISINSSQIVLAESKLMVRPKPSSELGNYMNNKINAAYANRSNNSLSKRKLKSLASIDMLKKYYKNKRNKHSNGSEHSSIQLYNRYRYSLNTSIFIRYSYSNRLILMNV